MAADPLDDYIDAVAKALAGSGVPLIFCGGSRRVAPYAKGDLQ